MTRILAGAVAVALVMLILVSFLPGTYLRLVAF